MMKIQQNITQQILITLLFVFTFGYTFNQTKKTLLEIQFEHNVGKKPLKLDSLNYTNPLGQPFTVTKFNYYISNIRLIKKDGKEFVSSESFLIKEEDELSKSIPLSKVPPGEYISIQFTLGVDSIKNCSGIQAGALDPIHGMFWTWNTGYIFLKFEGQSSASSLPNKTLEYHIGGFKTPNNCIRTITLPLNEPLLIVKKQRSKLTFQVDVMEILKSPTTIDFSLIPAVTGVENSLLICTNYMDMFSIKP